MFERLSFRLKLVLLSAFALGALIAAVLVGVAGIRSGIDGVKEIGRQRLPSVIALQAIREIQTSLKSSTYEVALWENDADAQDQFAQIAVDKQKTWERADAALKEYEAIAKTAEESEIWSKFLAEWSIWKKVDLEIIELAKQLAANKDAGRQKTLFEKYFALGGQQRQPYVAAEKFLDNAIGLNAKIVAAETERAEKATSVAQTAMISVGIAAVVVVSGMALLLIASILRQMGGDPSIAVSAARAIAEGDLRVDVPVKPGDEKSLLASVAYMQDHLRRLIGEILGSAGLLSVSARDLASDVSHLSASGKSEAKAATSTAQAVSEITDRVKQVGESAEMAKRLSEEAGKLSREGQEVVRDASSEMNRIVQAVHDSAELIQKLGTYSNQISAVVNVIKEVADQTNLLALNAAIEAARAGEQGRGFAVVADEVRKLAERTGQSTQDISNMITNIQTAVTEAVESMHRGRERVEEGMSLVSSATVKMEHIHSGAVDASQAVNEITESLRISGKNLHDITELMGNIVNMVDVNSDSIGAMTRSATNIENMASRLEQAASRFRIK